MDLIIWSSRRLEFGIDYKCEFFDQFLKVLTTGGTIDKEYPQGVGGYAFEFGTVTAAQRIKKRTHSKFEIERICSVDSQGMNILSLFGATSVETFLLFSRYDAFGKRCIGIANQERPFEDLYNHTWNRHNN